jgi:hypothetical protein
MYDYYQNHPLIITTLNKPQAATSSKTLILSDFDKHCETMLSKDIEEGWAAELQQYLNTMLRNVRKQTDVIEWWQVSV